MNNNGSIHKNEAQEINGKMTIEKYKVTAYKMIQRLHSNKSFKNHHIKNMLIGQIFYIKMLN